MSLSCKLLILVLSLVAASAFGADGQKGGYFPRPESQGGWRKLDRADEIRHIADTGGVVAVIFMNYWLGEHTTKDGLDAIVATAKQIADVGGIDTVAFGSDFDGFTDPPDDIKDISQMPRLTDALLAAQFSESDVEKILGRNMERVLRAGWR